MADVDWAAVEADVAAMTKAPWVKCQNGNAAATDDVWWSVNRAVDTDRGREVLDGYQIARCMRATNGAEDAHGIATLRNVAPQLLAIRRAAEAFMRKSGPLFAGQAPWNDELRALDAALRGEP